MPLELDYPYWIEDERFDLEYHVRHISLPRGRLAAVLHPGLAHPRGRWTCRPLWSCTLVEGLDTFLDLPPDSFAILAKIHHAAIDVNGGAEITTLLHDTTPVPPQPDPPSPVPGAAAFHELLLARAAFHNIVSRSWSPHRSRARCASSRRSFTARSAMRLHPRTPACDAVRFRGLAASRLRNAAIHDRRVQAHPRAGARLRRSMMPCLRVCGGALRRYLVTHDELPAGSWSFAPLSIRNADSGAVRKATSA